MKNLAMIVFTILAMLLWSGCGEKAAENSEEEKTTTEAEIESPATERYGGMTLYTVREAMKEDPKGTLKKIADIGYKYIEATGYKDGKFYGMEPTEFDSYLKSLGLELVSSHHGDVNLENADQMIAACKAAGVEFFVIPIPPMGHFSYNNETKSMSMSEDLEEVTGILNTIGQKCKDAGIQMLYHNHDFEFKENAKGIIPIEHFLENTDPAVVNFQLDLYWVTKAGGDPLAYFEKYPGRFKIWHVKDMDTEGKFAPVGEGTIDFSKILAQKDQSGMEFYIVEQDRTFDLDPVDAVGISHKGLKEFGFN